MLRKDAEHSRITLPDGGAPVKLSSPPTRLTHHQPGFYMRTKHRISQRSEQEKTRHHAGSMRSLILHPSSITSRITQGASPRAPIAALISATKAMGDRARDALSTPSCGPHHAAHNRPRNLRKQVRRAHGTHRGPAGLRRDANPHHAACATPTTGARVAPLALRLILGDPKLAVGDRITPRQWTKRLDSAVTLGLLEPGCLINCFFPLVGERDNPRRIDRKLGLDRSLERLGRVGVCAGRLHHVPK